MMRTIFVTAPLDHKLKTVFAAHLAIALSDTFQTAIVNDETSDDALQLFLAKRHHLNLSSQVSLPVPAYFAHEKNILHRLKEKYDFAIVNAHDLRNAAESDIVVILASDNETLHLLTDTNSTFANAVWNAKKQRATNGHDAFSSVVVALDALTDNKSLQTASMMGYLLAPVLKNPALYLKGFERGLTVLDKNLPAFQDEFGIDDFFARRNFKELVEYILRKNA